MKDWFLESLRRALVCGVLVLFAAIMDMWQVTIASLVALLVFLLFLLRNPDGWARRLSYACTMLGAGALMQLGTAIKATGLLKVGGALQNAAWFGALVVQLEQGPPWPGVALLTAGLLFGVIQVIREGKTESTKEGGTPALRSWATHVGIGQHQVGFTVPVKNSRAHRITINRANVEALRWLDRFLVMNASVTNAVSLEGGTPQERVELPADIEPGSWKRLDIELAFTDCLGSPKRKLGKLLFWLIGLRRRYLRLRLEDKEGDRQVQETLIVLI